MVSPEGGPPPPLHAPIPQQYKIFIQYSTSLLFNLQHGKVCNGRIICLSAVRAAK